MKKVDMSSDAITRRLRQTEQLRKLSLSLMRAKILTDSEAVELRKRNQEDRARRASDAEARTK
ncbi:MAG: hypothetical protein IT174_11430 [Acidobacteria bacterium]|nr:hypothetical protein [Acidobacteriota bacterium]